METKDAVPGKSMDREGGTSKDSISTGTSTEDFERVTNPKPAAPEPSVKRDDVKKSEVKPEQKLKKEMATSPGKPAETKPESKPTEPAPGPLKKEDGGKQQDAKKDGVSKVKLKTSTPSPNADRGGKPEHKKPVSGLASDVTGRHATMRQSIKKLKSLFPKQFEVHCQDEEPKPLQLLIINEDHTFELNEDELTRFLLRDEVKDLHVVIVSVAGAFRKGKSFLLDFFLRYLKARGSPDWMGDENSPLTGFVWRGGCERNTSGILVWNEIFRVQTPSGEVGVILMDTQGSFDSGSTVRECATIFALSTMTSSVQVYNLSQNIQEDDLQHLQLFTEYGRLAIAEGDYEGTPFQKLVFLVRDWSYPYEARYGRGGGKELLERRLQVNERQHEELQLLREHIRSCFASIDCFLLPHPGLVVATAPQFDGRSKDIDKEFLTQLEILVPSLLAPENLTIKEINGRKVTCQELLEYIRAYVKVFGSNELPEPKSILVATAEANNLAAVAICREFYNISMSEICGGDQPYINPRDLEAHHLLCRESTKAKFESTRKMGGEDFSQAYLEKLLNDLDESYASFQKHNDRKNIFTAMKTPACLLTAVVGSYVASSVFNLFRISAIANLCQLVSGFLTSVAVAWGYIRYSGEYPYVGQSIDQGADLLYGHVLKPIGDIASPKLMEYIGSARRRSSTESPTFTPRLMSTPPHKRTQGSPRILATPPKTHSRMLASRPAYKQ